MADERRIRELLEQVLQSGSTPEEVCREAPELLPTIRERLEQIRHVDQQIDEVFFAGTEEAMVSEPLASARRLPQIAGYDIEGILGWGGMGIVYKAVQQNLNRLVAIKMLVAGPFATPLEVARFLRESRSVSQLKHPNIVQVYDVGEHEGRPYYTMEFLDGGNLAQSLNGVPQSARRSAELTATLAMAVDEAHWKGIIHRDLKPANILLTNDGTPKIADFGLARQIQNDARLTTTEARIGTPSYMAPEQALGQLETVGPLVDVYALGAILYELLTGRPPFRAESAVETEQQVVTDEPVPPSQLIASIPRRLETICLKCLQKKPSRRYASGADLAEDLDRFLNCQPVRAQPEPLVESVWRWACHNRAIAAAFTIVTLLTMIVFGSLWAATYYRAMSQQE